LPSIKIINNGRVEGDYLSFESEDAPTIWPITFRMACRFEAHQFDRCACAAPHLAFNLLAHGGYSVLEKQRNRG
jgi:hypothetical protein